MEMSVSGLWSAVETTLVIVSPQGSSWGFIYQRTTHDRRDRLRRSTADARFSASIRERRSSTRREPGARYRFLLNSRSWKSKLKSVSGEIARIFIWSTLPS
jgi:hypothetical protein